MRKVFLFMALFFVINVSLSQNFNWITPNKTYLKLYLVQDGIYRINKSDFTNAGISTTTIDPRTVKVLYKGSQVPIYFEGESDGVFNDNDFFDFYGTRNHGGDTKYLDGLNNSVKYTKYEYNDYYSDTSVYWIDWNGSNGLRMTDVSSSNSFPLYPREYFFDAIHGEVDAVYTQGENINNDTDFRRFSTELVEGEGWYWGGIGHQQRIRDSVLLKNLYLIPSPLCGIKFFAYPNANDTNRLRIIVDNATLGYFKTIGYQKYDTTVFFTPELVDPTTAYTQLFFTYYDGTPGNITGNVYFDSYDFIYPSLFRFYQNTLSADLTTNVSSDTTTKRFRVLGYSGFNPITLYDVRNGTRITNFSTSSDTLSFSAKNNANLRINNSTTYKKPFRIKQRQVVNLAGVNAADYIIVYPKPFEAAAEQLRQHRQSNDTLRTFKANVEDIYDIFNYGMENPAAVRTFVKNAYITWQAPKVKYLCLFGRGSIDPKKNSALSIVYTNFVPSYGNPTCDGYFGNVREDAIAYIPHVAVGRLPAYTEQEALNIVTKIISYDNQRTNYSPWWKNSVMITGGLNLAEQSSFKQQSNSLIESYLGINPLRLASDRIYRSDAGGGISFLFSDSIINSFNRGALFFNYIGHAGNGTWDNGLENPDLLSNGTKLPLVFSMTCFTGKNAISERREFGEKFIYLPNKGAIGFIGNSGWTFEGNGVNLNRRFLDGFKSGIRRQGDIMKYSIVTDSVSSGNPNSYQSRFTANTYGLLGDPASKILLPSHPEFEILPGNFSLSNPFPAVNESVNLKLFPSNYGIGVDSVKFRFQIFRNGVGQTPKDSVLKNYGRLRDTVSFNFTVTSGGNYSLRVTIDPENFFPQEDKTNNTVNINLPIRNVSYVPLKPVDNSFVMTDSVEFAGINPNVDATKNNVRVILHVDTVSGFTNPRIFFKQVTGGVTTKFKTTLPLADSNLVYYWRMNSVINNDSSGWSTVQRLIYNPSGTLDASSVEDSIVKLSKKRLGQFDLNSYEGLVFNSESGFILPSGPAQLRVKSFGMNANQATEFSYNGGLFRIDANTNHGLNIVTVNKRTGRFIKHKNFYLVSQQTSDSVVSYLDDIDTNTYVLIAKASVFFQDSLRQNAKDKIKEFGSTYVDSLRGYFHNVPVGWNAFQTWAFIGYKGASPKEAEEGYNGNNVVNGCEDNFCPSFAEMTKFFQTTRGELVQNFGPARSWKNFSANFTMPKFSGIKYTVFGKTNLDQTVLLYNNVDAPFSLDTVNSLIYPNLIINTVFSLDSLQGITPPSMKSFVLNYIPPVELAVDNYSFTRSDTVLQEGDTVTVGASYTNVGYSPITSTINTWYTFLNGQQKILRKDTILTPIIVDEIRNSEVKFSTAGYGYQGDSINIYFESYPAYPVNEFSSYNSTGVTQIVVKADSLKPVAKITFDGVGLTNGDFIQANPEIVIELFDDSPIALQGADTNTIKIKLDSRYIPYANNPDIQFLPADGFKLAATVKYFPKLSEGDHKIEFNFVDKTGNIGDTIKNNFLVSYDLKLLSLNNFPNPFKDKTTFMFNLTGEKRPDTGKIRIYSAAGRLVKEIPLDYLIVGYNQVEWDGRDNDGDAMANGIYFYKMILSGNSKIETKIEKIAILR